MRHKLRFATVIPAALLILAFVFTLAFACSGLTADAAQQQVTHATEQASIVFGQMSDIHYFPAEYCYSATAEDYYDSDFYHSTTGDTKLVIESGDILDAHVDAMLDEARAPEGKAPHFLFATGDLSKNGEHAALIDVANKLRYLQNEMRKIEGYENFQVFAVQGNHDLYNGSGKLYDENGKEYQAEVVTSAQFALIFAGLGYPDMTEEELEKIYPSDYWFSSYTTTYIESTTADNVTITYFNQNLQNMADNEGEFNYDDYTALFNGGETVNALSYYVEFTDNDNYGFFVLDGTDREMTEDTTLVRVNSLEYDAVQAELDEITANYNAANGEEAELARFYVEQTDGSISQEPATAAEIDAAFAAGKAVYANTGYDHLTGGRLTEELLDWMREKTAQYPDRTYVAAYHFNVLPHFEQEDDILKDFVFYNWEYIAKEFLKMGVRYGISGHMHASDIAYYHDAAGRTFYDIETGSSVSYASPRRYMTITRYDLGEDGSGEGFESSLHILDSFEGMNSSETYADYNEYITDHIYGDLVGRIVDHFITIRTIDDLGLAELADGLISIPGVNLPIGKIVQYLLDEITDNLYPAPDGYPGFEGQTQPTDLMDYIKKGAAQELIGMKFGAEGNELTLAQIFSFIMMAHAAGVEPTTAEVFGSELPEIVGEASETLDPLDPVWRARYIAALRDFAAKCDSGQLAKDLFGILLDTLYYDEDSILKTLLSHEFSLSGRLNGSLANMLVSFLNNPTFEVLDDLLTLFKIDLDPEILAAIEEAMAASDNTATGTITIDRFVLSEALDALWPIAKNLVGSLLGIQLAGDNIYQAVEGLLDSYLTDSFYVGLSGIAKNIVIAYATDDEIDLANKNDPTAVTVLTPHPGYADGYDVKLTYVSDMPADDEYNAPTQDNGRLPSHLTANFLPSDEDGAKFTLSFYTAEEIGAEVTLTDSNGNPVTINLTEDELNTSADKDYRTVSKTSEDGTVTLKGGTYAQYIPLIDLGLLTISHTETEWEDADGNVHPYTYQDRDNAPANSVVYRNRWTVTFEGLNYNETYTYAVRGVYGGKVFDLAAYTGNENFTFTTPSSAEVPAQDFDFIAIADMQGMIQSMYEDSASAIEAIMANAGGYDFVLNAGDMADNGDNFSQWGWALNENLDFFANTSTFNTAGNHEDGGGKLDDFYNYGAMAPEQDSDSGLYYSFDYATAHVIVLNTNDADGTNGLSDTQFEWLKADLEANKDAKWIFVLMHKSLYSGGSHSYDADVVAMRAQLVPVFYKYGVDLVLAGHDHTYTVTECLDGNGDPVKRASYNNGTISMNADGSGVMYVTLGTIGTKFYDYVSNSAIEDKFSAENSILATLTAQTFAKISVNGDTLTYTGYSVNDDGTVSVIYNEPADDLLLVKILVPIAGVILIAGIVVTVVLVKKNKAKKAAAE